MPSGNIIFLIYPTNCIKNKNQNSKMPAYLYLYIVIIYYYNAYLLNSRVN